MFRIIKLVIVLGLIGFAALTVYAYLGDLAPDRTTVSDPVELDVD